MVEDQNLFESRYREPCASPTIGRNEKDEHEAEDSNDGSTLLGFAFSKLEFLVRSSRHCKAGYLCPLAPQGFQAFLEIQIQHPTSGYKCLDRIVAPVKDRPVSIILPMIKDASDLPKMTGALLAAAAAGKIVPSEAAILSRVVDAHRGALEIADITERIERLEEEVKK